MLMNTLRFLVDADHVCTTAASMAGCSAEAKKARLTEQADRDFKSGEYDKAKIEYMNLLRLDPQSATAYQQLGLIWFEEGAPLRAAPFLLKARELAPNNLNNRAKLASTYLSVGAMTEARKEALAILRQSPGYGDAIKILAETTRTPQEVDESNEQLLKFPQRDSVAFHLATAFLALRKGDVPSTEKALHGRSSWTQSRLLRISRWLPSSCFKKTRSRPARNSKPPRSSPR